MAEEFINQDKPERETSNCWDDIVRICDCTRLLREQSCLGESEAKALAEHLVLYVTKDESDIVVLDTVLHYLLEPVSTMMGDAGFAVAIHRFFDLVVNAFCSLHMGELPDIELETKTGSDSKECLCRYLRIAWWLGVHAGIKEVAIHSRSHGR